jgi:hypothetical protein
MHSLLLHAGAPAAHLGAQPRFLLSKDIHQPLTSRCAQKS